MKPQELCLTCQVSTSRSIKLMQESNSEAERPKLSKELWSVILAMAKPDNAPESSWKWTISHEHDLQRFYHLRHVCRMFDKIFRDNPTFESVLCLRRDLTVERLSGLLPWVSNHGSHVQTLTASAGTPFVDATLGALHSHHLQTGCSALQAFHAQAYPFQHFQLRPSYLPDTSLLLLQPFTSLITCSLDLCAARESAAFGLASLGALPYLTNLSLSRGNFGALELLQHLTQLNLSGVQAQCLTDAACATSLVKLHMGWSLLGALHELGVCARTRLEVLQCSSCNQIEAANDLQTLSLLSDEAAQIPDSLSCLSRLTRVELFYGNYGSEFNVGWLAQLPLLQHICTTLNVGLATFPSTLSVLSRLTNLCAVNNNPGGCLAFALDWSSLRMLQRLSAKGTLQFSTPLANLASLQHLEEVVFTPSAIAAETAAQIAVLGQQMADLRHDVAFTVIDDSEDDYCDDEF